MQKSLHLKTEKKTGVLIIHTIPLKAKSKTVMWYDVVYHGTEMDWRYLGTSTKLHLICTLQSWKYLTLGQNLRRQIIDDMCQRYFPTAEHNVSWSSVKNNTEFLPRLCVGDERGNWQWKCSRCRQIWRNLRRSSHWHRAIVLADTQPKQFYSEKTTQSTVK